MPVFGAITKKVFSDGYTTHNRYWLNAGSLTFAASHALLIAAHEAIVFCQYAVILNVHFWVPGVTPNQKITITTGVPGEYGASGMLRPQIVARVFWDTPETSNPMFKDFRCRVASGELANGTWGATYLAALAAYKAEVDGGDVPYCTKNGTLLGAVTPSNRYEFRQLSKQWHNRPSSP